MQDDKVIKKWERPKNGTDASPAKLFRGCVGRELPAGAHVLGRGQWTVPRVLDLRTDTMRQCVAVCTHADAFSMYGEPLLLLNVFRTAIDWPSRCESLTPCLIVLVTA